MKFDIETNVRENKGKTELKDRHQLNGKGQTKFMKIVKRKWEKKWKAMRDWMTGREESTVNPPPWKVKICKIEVSYLNIP